MPHKTPPCVSAAILIMSCGVVVGAQQPPASTVPQQATASRCPVAEDDQYGYTKEMPIQIGGGAFYVAARERRYMDSLRGPAGQPIQYKRLGSTRPPDADDNLSSILDLYEVAYEGLDKPVQLYLDAYHYWPQRAPKGFICGQPIGLAPLLDQFRGSDDLRAVAIEQGATRSFAPIPLGVDGATTHGVMFDAFRLIALAASAAAAAGKSMDDKPVVPRGTAVLAHALKCGERSVLPAAVDILDQQGAPVRRVGDYAKDEAIRTMLPGVMPPEGSLAAMFVISQPRPGDRVRITYAEACPGGAADVALPVQITGAKPASFPPPVLPEGAAPQDNRVLLQVFIDFDGAMQRPTYTGGPLHLRQPAIDAVKSWRAEPGRINGAPIGTSTLLEVRFNPRALDARVHPQVP